MKFKLDTANTWYDAGSDKERLEQLGFEFEGEIDTAYARNGEFCITDKEVEIEINSLEELMELIKSTTEVIVSLNTITIYDGYVE